MEASTTKGARMEKLPFVNVNIEGQDVGATPIEIRANEIVWCDGSYGTLDYFAFLDTSDEEEESGEAMGDIDARITLDLLAGKRNGAFVYTDRLGADHRIIWHVTEE
jgi:hypothetical protein